MYNRYIPADADYTPVHAPEEKTPRQLLSKVRGSDGLGGIKAGLGGLLKGLCGGELDTGDILLALIVLFLILEDGDSLDVIITLGLMILFSLGEKAED